jgi:D-glycero-D-manno-heptose 1,7-bisphosphate phosphatase
VTRAAVFLDRDGVLVEDVHLATHREQLRIVEGVEEALERLRELGLVLVVVTNQTVVARVRLPASPQRGRRPLPCGVRVSEAAAWFAASRGA